MQHRRGANPVGKVRLPKPYAWKRPVVEKVVSLGDAEDCPHR
jgi:hypothetical protein